MQRRGPCWIGKSDGLSVKAEIPAYGQLRDQFAANLERADILNRQYILSQIGTAFHASLQSDDLSDVRAEREAALERWDERMLVLWQEWSGRPDRFPSLRRKMEDDLLRAFRGLINERRQRALGVAQYVWRSRDDAKVRVEHSRYDDKVFDWDEPPEGGHPGQAWNCRCYAEPYLSNEPPYVPDTGAAYWAARAAAEWDGTRDAAGDFAGQIIQSIEGFPGQMQVALRYLRLRTEEALGTLSPQEERELADMRSDIDTAIAGFKQFFREAPELAADFASYVWATEARVALVDEAYRKGLATRGQLEEAIRDRAWLETMLGLNIAPGLLASKLLKRLGGGRTSDISGALRARLAAELARLRRHPADVDWDIVENSGILWGGAIRQQGGPWEEVLAEAGGLGVWIEERARNFRTFDFFDEATGAATSAKTLDTRALSYVDRPSRIYAQLRVYVDKVDRFEDPARKRFPLPVVDIKIRRLELAVPFDTTPEQIIQIQRAIEYAEGLGIEMEVSFIR